MFKNKWIATTTLLAVSLALFVGCGTSSPTPPPTSSANVNGAAYLLASEPANAKGVKEVRAAAKDADEVTLVGRIGGDINPWVDGQAAFLIVDSSMKPCNEKD